MPWFPTTFEWAPPAGHAGDKPYLLWTDAQQLTVLWFSYEGILCRQDFIVDPTAGSMELTAETYFDTADPILSQQIVGAQVSPTGALLIDTYEESSG